MKRAPAYLAPQRRIPRYPSAPAAGPVEPDADIPVHLTDDRRMTTLCRVRSAEYRTKTTFFEKVTCPACLARLATTRYSIQQISPVPFQPLPCGSPVGDSGLAVDRALPQ